MNINIIGNEYLDMISLNSFSSLINEYLYKTTTKQVTFD